MLEPSIKIEKKDKKEFPPLPEDVYQVELLDVSVGERPTYDTRFKDVSEQEIESILKFQFTLLEGKDGDKDLRGRNVWVNFVPNYLYIGKNGKNVLYKIIEALIARPLSPTEEAIGVSGEFLNNLVGKQCRIGTKHKKSKDGSKVYDNVESYYPPKGTLEPLSPFEKEEAKVKPKDDKELPAPVVVTEVDLIDPDDIPF